MENKNYIKYRGALPATLVRVLEGNGTDEFPFEEVDYVLVFESGGGVTRQKTLGKVVSLTEEERKFFSTI